MLVKKKVGFLGDDVFFEGYVNDTMKWEGFHVPAFTNEVMEKLQEYFSDDLHCGLKLEKNILGWTYVDEEDDSSLGMDKINFDDHELFCFPAGLAWEEGP